MQYSMPRGVPFTVDGVTITVLEIVEGVPRIDIVRAKEPPAVVRGVRAKARPLSRGLRHTSRDT